MALGYILISAVPTPGGIVSSKYRDGDDSAAQPPTTPEMGQPNVLNDDAVDIPLVTASTGGTAPLVYELERSSTSGIAGFAVVDANADFSDDGVYSQTGLTAETQYWWRLACVDADLRRSGYSGVLTATTEAAGGGDVTAPTAPSNLVATSTTAGQASLTWVNGTDAVGIAFTDVLRGTSTGGTPNGDAVVIYTVVGSGTSYDDITAPAGAEVFYRVSHRDAAGNVSLRSSPYTVTIASASSESKRWNPGHYIKTEGSYNSTNQSGYWTTVFANLDKAKLFAPMKGGYVNVAWGAWNTTGSTYDWTALDALFAKADSLGFKLIVSLCYKSFGGGAMAYVAPVDLQAANVYQTTTGWITAVWRASVMNRFIAAVQAFADRYKNRSTLESITWSESTPSTFAAGFPSDYSRPALSAQLQSLTASAALMFPTSWVMCNVNSLVGQLTQMINAAHDAGAGFSTPDAVDTNGILIFRGQTVTTEQPPTHGDLRERMMHQEIASGPTLGGKDDNGPPADLIDWAQTNKVTHLSWVTSVTTTGNTWADIQAAITADPLLHTTYPTG